MSLISLIILPPRGTTAIALVIATIGLVILPWVGHDWRYWGLLTATTAIGPLSHPWSDLDNHHVLQLYGLVAITVACFATDRRWTLALTARLLVGAAFTFAVVWKVLSPDFLDGTFLTYLFTSDTTVGETAVAVGLQDPQAIVENRAAIDAASLDPTAAPGPVTLVIGRATAGTVGTLTWSTVALEVAIAVSFLVPLRPRWRWIRDATLLTFVLMTYPAAPVIGFGWVLTTLGLAQSDLRGHRAQVLYLGVFIALWTLLVGDLGPEVLDHLTGSTG